MEGYENVAYVITFSEVNMFAQKTNVLFSDYFYRYITEATATNLCSS